MAETAIDPRRQAHRLIDRMAPGQVAAALSALELLMDPFALALANAPYDDEPVSDEDLRDIDAGRASLARGELSGAVP